MNATKVYFYSCQHFRIIKFRCLDEILSLDFITLCNIWKREIGRQFAKCRIH